MLTNLASSRVLARYRVVLIAATLSLLGGAIPASAAPGDLDTTFSGDGWTSTDFDGCCYGHSAYSLAISPSGRIVAGGSARLDGPRYGADLALARYTPDGSPDASFADDGRQTTDVGFGDRATTLSHQADGRIVAAGGDGDGHLILVRYEPDGSLDETFGELGAQTTAFPGAYYEDAAGMVIQPDGKIVVAGYVRKNGIAIALARYDSDGSLDSSFASDGRQITDPCVPSTTSDGDLARGAVLQPDGKLLVAGRAGCGDDAGFAVLRYRSDGTLDPTFSIDGLQQIDFGGSSSLARSVAIQADGKIVLTGETRNVDPASSSSIALARLTPDGTLDSSFSGDGRQTTYLGARSAFVAGAALQTDGRIAIVATSILGSGPGLPSSENSVAVLRYLPDGSLDHSFSDDGISLTNLSPRFVVVFAMALQPDGKIVAAGLVGTDSLASEEFFVARFDSEQTTLPSTTPASTTPAPRPESSSAGLPSGEPMATSADEPVNPPACPRVEVIGARGSGDDSSGFPAQFGKPLRAFAKKLRSIATKRYGKAWMRAYWEDYGLPYGAIPVTFGIGVPGSYWASEKAGTTILKARLKNDYGLCNTTRYVLAGPTHKGPM